MKKTLIFVLVALFAACSSSDEEPRLMYDVSYTVTAANGATINKVEYRDEKGDLIELTSVTSPWTINLQVRAGLGLEAAAYGDVPYQGSLSISATWKPEGGTAQGETETLPNDTPNSTITNGRVDIPGRTSPD